MVRGIERIVRVEGQQVGGSRVVEQDEKNREFMMKQGIKISRK